MGINAYEKAKELMAERGKLCKKMFALETIKGSAQIPITNNCDTAFILYRENDTASFTPELLEVAYMLIKTSFTHRIEEIDKEIKEL